LFYADKNDDIIHYVEVDRNITGLYKLSEEEAGNSYSRDHN